MILGIDTICFVNMINESQIQVSMVENFNHFVKIKYKA